MLRLKIEVHWVRDATEEAARSARIHANVRHPPTIEALTEEIGRIVSERQTLRSEGAGAEVLEENRRRLAAAQGRLSLLLIEQYLPTARPA
jgi:hypothetical protein